MISSVSVPEVRKGSPAQYSIVVTLSDGDVYEVEHRFNDVLNLASELQYEVAEVCPVPPPQKRWLPFGASEQVLEERRIAIEVMLRALIRDPLFADSLALQRFLDVSRHRGTKSADGASWVSRTSDLSRIIADVKRLSGTQAREKLIKAYSATAQLQELLNSSRNLGQGERTRRQRQIDNYTQTLTGLDGQRSSYGSSETLKTNERVRLFGEGNTPRQGRVLGESDTTKRLNNHGLVDHQQQTMENQDAEIEQLRITVSRQRELGNVINEEIVRQNKMLDDLDEDVHRVNARVNQARRNTAKLS